MGRSAKRKQQTELELVRAEPTAGTSEHGDKADTTVISYGERVFNRAQSAIEENAALKRVYHAMRSLLAKAVKTEAHVRHALGREVSKVKRAPKTYGTDAVGTLAVLLNYEKSVLYSYALVSELWNERQLDELLAQKTPRGTTLYFSHLIVVSTVKQPARRAALLDRAVQESLSVRQLQNLIDRGEQSAKSDKNERTEIRLLRSAIAAWTAEATLVRQETSKLAALARKRPTAPVLSLLTTCAERQRALAGSLETGANELEALAKELSKGSASREILQTSRKSVAARA